ncbi:hypothetical protein QTP88_010347 [Uroleucon formosanum]
MHKQRFKCRHAKRKAKQKEALIACGNDKNQKKICFLPSIKQVVLESVVINDNIIENNTVSTSNTNYTNKYFRKNGGKRMWVSYNCKNSSLYCCICLAYGDGTGIFSNGLMKWKHVYALKSMSSVRKNQVENNRLVSTRIIEIVKLIAKGGLSYRGQKFEAAYTLSDSSLDHGNFLEMVLLVGKFDPVLKSHLDKVIKKSTTIHNSGTKQGGGLITFLSKTTVNYIVEALSQIIKSIISKEVEKAGMYSVQLDTTQDITVVDQCSIIVRYVIDTKIYEGIDFVNLLLNNFTKLGIDSKKCIGNSTDGAANMQGTYNEFSKKLSEVTLTQTHIWCHAHVLNLVICDITNKILQGISLFGLLNGCAVFLKESYTRMDIWTNKNTKQRIFTSLEEICENSKIKPEARLKAIGFIEELCKYETILTAQIYLRIFNITTPLSKYLQGHGVNFVAAFQMVNQTLNSLKNINRDFTTPIRHRKKTKQFAYECTDDNIIMDPLKLFEVNVYNVIFDSIIQSIQLRFEKHKELFADFNCLDPNNFYSKDCLPEDALKNIFTKIEPFQTNISYEQLRLQYIDFVSKWDKLKINCINIYNSQEKSFEESADESDNSTVTQVGCERSFSKLKYIKNYLRNSITQDHLESFILMSVEKDILTSISTDSVIDKVALNIESDHSHAGDEHVEIVEKAKFEMLKRISTTSTPSQIFAEVINQVPEKALTSFANEETTKRMLRCQKSKGNPKKPSCLSELIIKNEWAMYKDERFLLYDNGSESNERIIIFSLNEGLVNLSEADTWFCYQSFKLSPEFFLQLYVIRFEKYNKFITPIPYLL